MEILGKIKNLLQKLYKNIFNVLKGKRFFIIILLFFVLSGIILPKVALAIPWWICPACQLTGVSPIGSLASKGLGLDADTMAKSVFNALIRWIGTIPVAISAGLTSFTAMMLEKSMDDSNFFSYTGFDNPVITVGWPIMRDFANMFVVLGFVIIGLATILRFRNYEAQKLLPWLIGAALLINFSLVICRIFIDASNILITYFNESGNALSKSWSDNILEQIESLNIKSWNFGDDQGWLDGIGKVAALLVQNYISIFIYFLFAVLFIGRRVALWILVILSPLAFISYVFPFSRGIWTKWWNNFFAWCIIGVGGSFFIFLGNKISEAFLNNPPKNTLIAFFVPAIFLIIGFLASLQTSAMGASMITSQAKKAWSKSNAYLSKGTKAGAGKLANISGATGLYNRAKDRLTQVGEGMGWVQAGTMTKNRRTRLSADQRSARLAQMSDAEKAALWAENRAGNDAILDRAAITKEFAGKNKLSLLGNQANQQRAIEESLNNGVRFNELIGGMNSTQVADIINNPAAHAYIQANQREEARAEGFKTLMKRGQLDLIDAGRRTAVVNEALTHGLRPEEAERADYHYGESNEARLDRIATARFGGTFATRNAADQATIRQQAIEQTLDENIGSMSQEQLRNIDEAHLRGERGYRRIDRLTPDKINAFQYSSNNIIDAVKSHFDPGDPDHRLLNDINSVWAEYQAALSAGDQAAATNRFTEYRRLRALYVAQNNLP